MLARFFRLNANLSSARSFATKLIDKDYQRFSNIILDENEKTIISALKNVDFNQEHCNGLAHLAIRAGKLDVVEFMLRNGLNINQILNFREYNDKNEFIFFFNEHTSLLGEATIYKKHNIIEFLLENGADPNLGIKNFGTSPLSIAAFKNDLTTAKILLKNHANPNSLDIFGDTPLFIACHNQYMSMVELLFSYNADPNIQFVYYNYLFGKNLTAMKLIEQNERLQKIFMKVNDHPIKAISNKPIEDEKIEEESNLSHDENVNSKPSIK